MNWKEYALLGLTTVSLALAARLHCNYRRLEEHNDQLEAKISEMEGKTLEVERQVLIGEKTRESVQERYNQKSIYDLSASYQQFLALQRGKLPEAQRQIREEIVYRHQELRIILRDDRVPQPLRTEIEKVMKETQWGVVPLERETGDW